jgi:glycerophosphoryl diester phosphodiesterase
MTPTPDALHPTPHPSTASDPTHNTEDNTVPSIDSNAASPKVVGHRGAARIAPENSLKAFRAGVAAGAQLLECDVHLSADGQLVVMHDTSIDRTAAEDSPLRSGKIADLTRTELDTVRLPEGEAVPTLDEVLDVATGAGVPIYVEVKAAAAAEKTAQLLVERGLVPGAEDPTTAPASIISFSLEALRIARKVSSVLPLVAVTSAPDEEYWKGATEVGACAASLSVAKATDQDVAHARELGLYLNVWTVNEPEQLRRAVEVGARTITTDDPAWVLDGLAGTLDD